MSRFMPMACCLGAALLLGGCEIVNGDEVAAPRVPAAASGGGALAAEASFASFVGPLLVEKCGPCHNASSQTGGLDATSFDTLFEKEGFVVPGDPDGSLLVQFLEGKIMPPPGNPRPTDDEVAAIRAWVEAGAPDN